MDRPNKPVLRHIVKTVQFHSLLALFPCIALAAGDCRVVVFPDHYEAVCEGNPTLKPEPSKQDETDLSATRNGAQASRKRQRIEEIRTLNSHRTVPPEAGEPVKTAN